MRKSIATIKSIIVALSVIVSLFACNGTKYVGDDELLLTHNSVVSDNPNVSVNGLLPYLTQKPNTKWFSTLKVPLGLYSMSGRDTTKVINRKLRQWGEAPVILDTTKITESSQNLLTAMQNKGYLDANVLSTQEIDGKRVKMTYVISPQEQYTIRNIRYEIADKRIDSLLKTHNILNYHIHEGGPFSVNALHAERGRITNWLNEQGFMYFNKEAITFVADSSRAEKFVDVTMRIGLYRASSNEKLHEHPRYLFRNITYEGANGQKLKLKDRTLDINTIIRENEYYNSAKIQKTYNRFARLQAIRSTNIHFSQVKDSLITSENGDNLLDAQVQLSRKKTHSLQLQPEGTNTSGDFGAALSITYENRNLFHGSESFSLQARGAFEAISGLEGYQGNRYEEYGIEGKLKFPEFIIPGISRDFQRRHYASSELLLSYNLQNRPEFHRRVLTAAWRYRWASNNEKLSYKFDFLDINYVSMPWISATFKHNYLDSVSNRNAILRYNYEDLLIMKTGIGASYSDGKNIIKTNIEAAGNALSLLSQICDFNRNEEGQYKVARVAFAQYAKFDADYTRLLKLDYRNTLALHARVGLAIPYGNSTILPFEKRYFAGGANSVRGWSVRSLGPGGFHSTDGSIDFINQTGDIKIDLNAELRTDLFWKFQGAVFIDAGNIWTIHRYADQPNGFFTTSSLINEMAVAYGVGLRLNFDYFILRLDLGMKAINPDNNVSSKAKFPIIYPVFKRDYALHFAVGLPF